MFCSIFCLWIISDNEKFRKDDEAKILQYILYEVFFEIPSDENK